MSRIITKELALRIARKLDAEIVPGKKHDAAEVCHKGEVIAWFGIRKGSDKDLGHDHVPGDLFITPHEARLLGQCPLSKDAWIRILEGKGKIRERR